MLICQVKLKPIGIIMCTWHQPPRLHSQRPVATVGHEEATSTLHLQDTPSALRDTWVLSGFSGPGFIPGLPHFLPNHPSHVPPKDPERLTGQGEGCSTTTNHDSQPLTEQAQITGSRDMDQDSHHVNIALMSCSWDYLIVGGESN